MSAQPGEVPGVRGQVDAPGPADPQETPVTDPQETPVTIVAHDVGSVGGMERQLEQLIVGLRRRGHPVTVIARKCVLPAGTGVTFHRVAGPSRPFLIAYPWFALAGSLLVARHRRGVVQSTGAIVVNRVDVVAVHCCHRAYTAMPGRPTRLFRAYGMLVGLVKRVGERLCVRANDGAAFVCVSEGVAAEMRRFFPAVAGRVLTIHNGVDTERFAPRPERRASARERWGLAGERLVAVFVGGDWEHKGLRFAIEALQDAPDWQLAVAGPGLSHLYERLGGAERVRWLGRVSEIETVYDAGDAFVLPSAYETFSLVAYEAAASGLPVLTTPVNGVSELIEDGRSGFFVSRDAGAIAARLNELAADPGLRARLGASARESSLRFTWQAMVDTHHDLYVSRVAARS